MKTKENLGYASPRLLSLKRVHLNQIVHMLIGHYSLQGHQLTLVAVNLLFALNLAKKIEHPIIMRAGVSFNKIKEAITLEIK